MRTRVWLLAGAASSALADIQVDWVQTARSKDGLQLDLLKAMEPLTMSTMAAPTEHAISIDISKTFQEIVGFGGAFTEAAAIRWRQLTPEDQAKVIDLYFGDPADGGHGYTLGRVPINSCDFSPASYNFDDVEGDMELEHFDTSVKHDVEVGMIPMIHAAKEKLAARGTDLTLFASPWSPPKWMKVAVEGVQDMTVSASPVGLMASMQRPWATYFSKFISAYKAQGIDIWGVTVQNEPEAAVGWEACLWTAKYMASFVRDHLGPVLQEQQPGVKIIGFDHNKDHVAEWAKQLYEDPEAAKYFAGIGVHWYGGLNQHNLQSTHEIAPDKFILGTEACNCGGVVFRTPEPTEWWSRAESLALDILEDLRFWAVGWTDWNLILGTDGGPNHLKNMCDANIITDPDNTMGMGTLIMQASYYYMGHFSRYIPAGSKRVDLSNSVQNHAPPLSADDVKNGQALMFSPCDGTDVQSWTYDDTNSLISRGTNEAEESDGYNRGGMCVDAVLDSWFPKMQVWACAHSGNQNFVVATVPGGKRLINSWTGKCLTAVKTAGWAVGLDAGVKVTAGQMYECYPPGTANQTFELSNYDGGGFPSNFPVRTKDGLCLQPQIQRVPHFDAVAFVTPSGSVSLVTINLDFKPMQFTLFDAASGAGATGLAIPPHSIQTYTYTPGAAAAELELSTALGSAASEHPAQSGSAASAAAAAASTPATSPVTDGIEPAVEAPAETAVVDESLMVSSAAGRSESARVPTTDAASADPLAASRLPALLGSCAIAATALAVGLLRRHRAWTWTSWRLPMPDDYQAFPAEEYPNAVLNAPNQAL